MASGDESNVSYHGEGQVECQDSSDSESASHFTKASNLEQTQVLTRKRDEPDVDEDGKPLLLRTTAVHRAFRRKNFAEIDLLFQIYNRFDVNYTDEFGLTHFHVACYFGKHEVVKNFLELGQDPNILLPETGDSPLHLAQEFGSQDEIELLLRYGADPNWANKSGLTPLHLINEDLTAEVFFKINDDRCQPLQVDARDEDGNRPLHFAVGRRNDKFIELLLRNGANPNLANKDGMTPLHVLSEGNHLAIIKLFFKINDELKQPVHIHARDKLGRTSLQWAVANFSSSCIDVLLDRGADLSSFVFPSASDFDEFFEENCGGGKYELSFRETSGALVAVERLENRGYELNRSDALTFMTFLVKHGAFKKSSNIDEFKYENETLLIVRCDDDNDDEDEEAHNTYVCVCVHWTNRRPRGYSLQALCATVCIVSSFLRQSTEREREKAIQRLLQFNNASIGSISSYGAAAAAAAAASDGARVPAAASSSRLRVLDVVVVVVVVAIVQEGAVLVVSQTCLNAKLCSVYDEIRVSSTMQRIYDISFVCSREVCCYPIKIITSGIFSGRSLIRSQMRPRVWQMESSKIFELSSLVAVIYLIARTHKNKRQQRVSPVIVLGCKESCCCTHGTAAAALLYAPTTTTTTTYYSRSATTRTKATFTRAEMRKTSVRADA
ncbi:unnamed protein product [Trichogramma brassicae]|uniref:Uncharacterized protein n=1 Tax=Trichogramma brassicae TaxID=86971 RepID=A0A6H5INL2_9HYME|nr:unnamed protein product [Trichogramma brassicae]